MTRTTRNTSSMKSKPTTSAEKKQSVLLTWLNHFFMLCCSWVKSEAFARFFAGGGWKESDSSLEQDDEEGEMEDEENAEEVMFSISEKPTRLLWNCEMTRSEIFSLSLAQSAALVSFHFLVLSLDLLSFFLIGESANFPIFFDFEPYWIFQIFFIGFTKSLLVGEQKFQ